MWIVQKARCDFVHGYNMFKCVTTYTHKQNNSHTKWDFGIEGLDEQINGLCFCLSVGCEVAWKRTYTHTRTLIHIHSQNTKKPTTTTMTTTIKTVVMNSMQLILKLQIVVKRLKDSRRVVR